MEKKEFTETSTPSKADLNKALKKSLVTAVFCIIFGFGLCLTGIGLLIGIPMIVYGLISPFTTKGVEMKLLRGKCPYCASDIVVIKTKPGATCRACKGRIIIKGNRLYSM